MLPKRSLTNSLSWPSWSKKLFKNKFLLIVLAILAVITAIIIIFSIQSSGKKIALAATCTWTGNSSSNFSDISNWSGCASGVPQDYDEMHFPSSANNYYLNNDLNLSYYGAFVVEQLTNQSYVLSGNDINNSQSLDTQASGGSFTFRVNALFCGINGNGTVGVDSGYTLTSGCNNGSEYTFSGVINGNGTFAKEGNGTQNLQSATIESGITTSNNGYFLQLRGNTTINGPVYSSGGLLLSNTPRINNFTQNSGGINLYPGNVTTFNSYDLNSGNFGSDASGASNYGKAFISNNTYLSNGTMSMRFFGSYNIGEAYTILGVTGGNIVSGQFSNAPADTVIIAEGWGASSVINDVGIRINYTSNSVIATIVSITSKACDNNKTYTQNTGTVTSGTIDYFANSNCKWVIAPNNADSVTLNFNTFNTEDLNDIVKVYDGITTSSPLLGTFSGTTIPGSLTANSGTMLITFTSNATIQASGFIANWTTIPTPSPVISSVNVSSGPIAGGTNIIAAGSNFVSGQYQNVRSLGSTGYDGVRGIVVDSTGQYVTGEFSGSITFGSTTLTSSGDQDIYIAKLDSVGNYLWAVKAGGTGKDGFTRRQSMSFDNNDGTLLIAGYYTKSATFGSTTLTGSGTGANIFVAKINKSNGSFAWAASGGGSTTLVDGPNLFPAQYATSPIADSNGNIYIVGRILGSNPTFGSNATTLVNSSGDLFVAKLNSSGTFQWVKNYGDTDPTSQAQLNGLAIDSSNNVYAIGSFFASITIGSTTLNAPSLSNSLVFKLDSSGNEIWAVMGGTVGPSNNSTDLSYDISFDSQGNLFATGYIGGANATFGSINVIGSATGASVYTAKINPSNGVWIWVKVLPSVGFATSRDMYIDSNDRIWIGGTYSDALTDGSKTITGNGANAFFAQYSTSGTLNQLQSIGGTGGQLLNGGVGGNQVRAVYEYNGKLYIAGEYFDTIGIGGQAITSAGNQDGFYTYYSPDNVSVKVGGVEVNASYVSATGIRFITPANTTGFKDIVVTNSNGQSYTLPGGYEYIGASITNSNISSVICSTSSVLTNTTVNCVITTNVDQNALSGSVNVRIGTGGTVVNCPVLGTGTMIVCNNVNAGNAAGTFASQFNASGSGSTYANGSNIIVVAKTQIQNSDISSLSCTPNSILTNNNVNCVIAATQDLSYFLGSVNVRIGTGGTVVNCPVTGNGTILYCNNIPVGNTAGTFTSQYNASGSGSTYLDGGNTAVTTGGVNCGSGTAGTASQGTTALTKILLCLNGGNLTLTSPSTANFTSVTASTTEQNTSAILNNIVVEDLRGSQAGWSLVCKSTNLTGILDNTWVLPVYKDSSSKLALTPSSLAIVNGYGSLGGLSDYTAAQSTTQLTNQTSSGESNNFNISSFATNYGVGKFEKNLNLDFTVPPYIRAQAYAGSLICSVS